MNLLSPFTFWQLLALALLGILAVVWVGRQQRGLLPRTIYRWSVALRTACLVLLLILLLNPAWIRSIPDPQAYQVALLAQASSSMSVEDTSAGSRLDWVRAELGLTDNNNNLRQRLAEKHPLRLYSFADEVSRIGTDLRPQHGQTAIGDAIHTLLDQGPPGGGQWGGVVLMSDGVQQHGIHPVKAARALGEAGIPVHVIGVGEPGSAGDLGVRFAVKEWDSVRGQPTTIEVLAENSFDQTQSVTLQLFEESELLETRQITLAASAVQRETFTVSPSRSGFRGYRVVLQSDAQRRNPLTDTDYATANVQESWRFHVLYIGRPQWEYRFLRILGEEEKERISVQAWMRTGPTEFSLRGFDEKTFNQKPDSFPVDPAAFVDVDTVILEGAIMAELPTPTLELLRDFVSQSGGGLMVIGQVSAVPTQLQGLLPARQWEVIRPRQNTSLTPQAGPLLRDEDWTLFTRPPALFLPANQSALSVVQMPRGARAALMDSNENAFVVYHAYGSGRIVYQGSADFWRWRMESAQGLEQHRSYWFNLLNWLSEARQPRLTTPLQGQVKSIEEPADLQVRILDNAFQPRSDARVRARVNSPDGGISEFTLLPKFGEPGLFEQPIDLPLPGEYRVRYDVTFPDGEILNKDIFFLANSRSAADDQSLQEALLRDIARLSGGNYYSWQNASTIRDLPLADQVPRLEKAIYWARTIPYALLILTLFALDWYLRRRYGLR